MKTKKIIAWHPVLTDHQAYTYLELSRQLDSPVVACVAAMDSNIRREQGWVYTCEGIERRLIPRKHFLYHSLCYLIQHRQHIHIFGSAFESPYFFLLLWMATLLRLEVYLISEPYSTIPLSYLENKQSHYDKFKVWFRPHLYRMYSLVLRHGIRGIFTISKLAYRQYLKAGIPKQRLFPFGYFVPCVEAECASIKKDNSKMDKLPCDHAIRFVFVGNLIARKGLSLLIDSVHAVRQQGINIQLDVYGHGEAQQFRFDNQHICYKGKIPFGHTQTQLADYDMLILPSYYDGWGVVVNESLCAGVPVLCSDNVGASVLIETFGAGCTFPAGDKCALINTLLDLAQNKQKLETMKVACASACHAIQPAQAVLYMKQVLLASADKKHTIASPWYGNLECRQFYE